MGLSTYASEPIDLADFESAGTQILRLQDHIGPWFDCSELPRKPSGLEEMALPKTTNVVLANEIFPQGTTLAHVTLPWRIVATLRLAQAPERIRLATVRDFPSWPIVGQSNSLPPAIVSNWSRLATATLSEAAYKKIFRMARRGDGWRGKGSRSLRPSSLRNFLGFWAMVCRVASSPQFALMPNGHIQALWSQSDRRRMDLEFAEDNRVYFGILDGRRQHEGIEGMQVLKELLLAHPSKPLGWEWSNGEKKSS